VIEKRVIVVRSVVLCALRTNEQNTPTPFTSRLGYCGSFKLPADSSCVQSFGFFRFSRRQEDSVCCTFVTVSLSQYYVVVLIILLNHATNWLEKLNGLTTARMLERYRQTKL
jgi:hypothetical protein